MKALDLLKTILENGLSSYNEEDDTVLVNGWWVTLEECIEELEVLQQPKSCLTCKHNDHEAQLKLASDVYSTDKMHMYQELKAKDEITQDIKEAYELKSIAYDLLLEAIKLKDEEIERLKEHITHLQNVYMKLDGKYLKLKTELEELKDNQ